MNEVEALQQSDVAGQTALAASAGHMLRSAREQQGVSLEALAGTLKVPVEKLQALESDDWRKLPDVVFARALAQSVCRVLHVSAADVLPLLPKGGASKLSSNPEGLNTPFKDKAVRSSVASQPEAGKGGLWKLVALVAIAAAGGAALYWLPEWEGNASSSEGMALDAQDLPGTAASNVVVIPVAPESLQTSVPAPVVMSAEPALAAAAESASALVVPAAVGLPSQPAAAASSAVPAQVAQLAPVAAPLVAEAAADAPVPTLRMRASGETWVQVRNTQGAVVLEKILKAGEVAQTSAARPLSVVIGKADVTVVEVDGAAWDLAGVARNNVARFEVK